MAWTYKTLGGYAGYGAEAPEWLLDERAEQRRQVAELRRRRDKQAERVFHSFAERDLDTEELPARFDAFLLRWRQVVVTELAIERKRRDNADALGYRARWVIRRLNVVGYSVAGKVRYCTDHGAGADDRMISRA